MKKQSSVETHLEASVQGAGYIEVHMPQFYFTPGMICIQGIIHIPTPYLSAVEFLFCLLLFSAIYGMILKKLNNLKAINLQD